MSSRYIPALDGLRALAVIAVVIYHMNATALQSGLLGVTLFFVLSGYLITGLLMREWTTTKKIDLPQFWIRRVRRLFPAIVFVILGTIVLTAAFAPDMLTKLRNDVVAALLFFTNWWYIFQDVSYFEAMGAPSPVTHFWSLAIEEQFYLIWPPILLLLLSKRVRKRHIQLGLLIAAVASVAAMAVLYAPQGDPSRVYYGTDTRAFSLIIGALLAFEFPPARVNGHGRRGFTDKQRKLSLIVGAVALAGMMVMMAAVNGYSPFLYYGGILLFSLFAGALIIALVDARSPLARLFSLGPLVWIGKLSYSIYLWHYPLLLLMNPRNFTGETPWFAYAGQALVILAASAVSYYLVETPLRRGAIGKAIAGIREKKFTVREYALSHAVQLGAGCALTVAAVVCLIVVPPTTTQQNTQLESAVVMPEAPPENAPSAPEKRTVGEMLAATEGETPADKARNTDFLLIGDSVSVALSDAGGYGYFGETFPRATLDAAIGRQLYSAKDVYQQHVDNGWDGPAVIFEVGTNGPATADDVREMVEAVPADKHVYLVNVRSPDPLQDLNNPLLQQAADEHDNVRIIDWHAASAGHDEYFDGDGTHLTPVEGCQAYLALIASALEELYTT